MIKSFNVVAKQMINMRFLVALLGLFINISVVHGQTFDFPTQVYVDSISLHKIVVTSGYDTIKVTQGNYSDMTSPTAGNGFSIKSIHALTDFRVNVQSLNVTQKSNFTYLIVYSVYGIENPASPNNFTLISDDTLSVSYNRDSLKLINDNSFKIAGKFHKVWIVVKQVFEYTVNSSGLVINQLAPADSNSVPSFVSVCGEIHVQKYMTTSSMNIAASSIDTIQSINQEGTVKLNWSSATGTIKPAGYEIEWTYVNPVTASTPYNSLQYNFRHNATRVFTNNTYFSIPIAQKKGYLVYRIRMVRPDQYNFENRKFGAWSIQADKAYLSSLTGSSGKALVPIPETQNDSLIWDLKMSFVEEGKYKEVITYYDGLMKPKQIQTRFNSRPNQTIIAQSLFDFSGRPVISTLPIPVDSQSNFKYLKNFLYPASATEYSKLLYDAIPDTSVCPVTETAIPPLDVNAKANKYYSKYKSNKVGKNAFIPDAEGYPLTRKIIAAENNEKLLFQGQAGSKLQLGNNRHQIYLYGAPLQAELNKYFGQDIGKYNYYRKLVTTDNHQQSMFTISDETGKPVATGLIGAPDTNGIALNIKNAPSSAEFKSNLLPIPDYKYGDEWLNNGSYFVETDANFGVEYKIVYPPFKPCSNSAYGLKPKIYYDYKIVDDCGNIKIHKNDILGGIGVTNLALLADSNNAFAYLNKGNHLWFKKSYVKLSDIYASVDQFLGQANGCYRTLNDFIKDEYLALNLPCENPYDDPCKALKLSMIKEMYPQAKYGQYGYADTISKSFGYAGTNSIFSIGFDTVKKYLYQRDCITYPDTVESGGIKYYNIKELAPQDFINIFNDEIATALLPLHPDYCKLLLCNQINNPFADKLSKINSASEAITSHLFLLDSIVKYDPLFSNGMLTYNELTKTTDGNKKVDSLAFKKTICGSEFEAVSSACAIFNANKTQADIVNYAPTMQDEYYFNLISTYKLNRDNRLSMWLKGMDNNCGPCAVLRLIDPSRDTTASTNVDATQVISGVDTVINNFQIPGTVSLSTIFNPSATITPASIAPFSSANNQNYCNAKISEILYSLRNCNVSSTVLSNLKDSLTAKYCGNGNSILNITYESLTALLNQLNIPISDLCNASLTDWRKITAKSGATPLKGYLLYSPQYYQDFKNFIENNSILDFIAGSNSSTVISVHICNNHPFEQKLAQLLGLSVINSSCTTTESVQMVRSFTAGSNTTQLSFIKGNSTVDFYLYPVSNSDTNALNTYYGSSAISYPSDFAVNPLFNLYGFNQAKYAYANRNTIALNFRGAHYGTTKSFHYFVSAFSGYGDDGFIEKDIKEYNNGVSCQELLPMVHAAVDSALALNIKADHPNFERYLTNFINYNNNINFDFSNYESAIQTCGITDYFVIPKVNAHFGIQFPTNTSLATVENYLTNLSTVDSIAFSKIQSFKRNNQYSLLLNVLETNSNTIKFIKSRLLSNLPSGAQLTYMPSFQRDTLAVLYSPSISPINYTALSAAFPNASFTKDTIEMNYFISGYGTFSFPGNRITIVQSITNDSVYNHQVNSICNYIQQNAPITHIYTHAETAVSQQYDDWQMKAWRDYMRTLSASDHNLLMKNLRPNQFNNLTASNGSASFSSSAFSYSNAKYPYQWNDLYIDHDGNGNSQFNYIKQLLVHYEDYNYSNLNQQTIFIPTTNNTPVQNLNGTNTETRTYVCGDTTYFLLNHFDAQNKMMNLFICLPKYLLLPRSLYKIQSIKKGFEKDSITYLNISFEAQQGSITDNISCVAYANTNLGATYTIPTAMLAANNPNASLMNKFEICESLKIKQIYPIATLLYHQYIDSIRSAIVANFRQDIRNKLQESFSIYGNDIKHGLTLYYYDMAGNLIRTVSPEGVKPLSVVGSNNDTINARRYRNELVNPSIPSHTKITHYKYNAQNKVVETTSPDGGTSRSIYDLMGRVIASQDAKQAANGKVVYFVYDNLSRVIETGLIKKSLSDFTPYQSQAGTQIASFIQTFPREEVTVTQYDIAAYPASPAFQELPEQDNLKNRVSGTRYFDAEPSGGNASLDSNYANALYYSYDISGNVKTLIHDLRTTVNPKLRFKRVDYEYDLYSGKVILVSYNRGNADQLFQKYSYDSDNRIVQVHTSENGLRWDRDASYDYYDHGPLARTAIGEQRVQGIDYAYTINGWMKAVNGVQNEPQNDMGHDGDPSSNTVMPKDVYAQRLDYFVGDYKSIQDSNFLYSLPAASRSLYNGNIAAIATSLTPFENLHSQYVYDPLHRIDQADYVQYKYNNSTATLAATPIKDYASRYRYDQDGNLLKLRREGATVSAAMNGGVSIPWQNMDDFTYRYVPGTNRLKNIQDSSSATAYNLDIPPTTGDTSLSQYAYDAIGNLTKDMISGLTNIDWNRFGKVKTIVKTDGTKFNFSYDPMGNRLAKETVSYLPNDTLQKLKTIYVRDASGNILAVYEDKRKYALLQLTAATLTADTNLGIKGNLPIALTNQLATELYEAQKLDSTNNLAKLTLSLPALADYASNPTLLLELTNGLIDTQKIKLLKSMPAITYATLKSGDRVEDGKLNNYLEPILLSEALDSMKTQLFLAIQQTDNSLFSDLAASITDNETAIEMFPDDQQLIEAFNSLELTDKLAITSRMATAVVTSETDCYDSLTQVLTQCYSPANTYVNFIKDVPNNDYILGEINGDILTYIRLVHTLASDDSTKKDSVVNLFKNNAVLASALAEPTQVVSLPSLSSLLSTQFPDVVNLASNSGKMNTLLASLKKVLTFMDMDLIPAKVLQKGEVLTTDKSHLAEHHLYGSSRLGIQKYLPDQYQYDQLSGVALQSLVQPRPWYSRYGNDLFDFNLKHSNSLSINDISTNGSGIHSHLLGKRHYELTNHLGNVQATVLDRVTPKIASDSVIGYTADISTAQDHYPFGMYMPGRYISDQTNHCVTINTTVLVPQQVQVWPDISTVGVPYQLGGSPAPPLVGNLTAVSNFAQSNLYLYNYLKASDKESGYVIKTNETENSLSYDIDLSGEPSGISAYMVLPADTTQESQNLGLMVERLCSECAIAARVRQYYGGNREDFYDLLDWTSLSVNVDNELTISVDKAAVQAGGKTILELKMTSSNSLPFVSGAKVVLTNPWTIQTLLVPQNHVATICDGGDDYRFGFNGQEKVNEIAGTGNHTTALFWEMDPRIARRWNLDPKPTIGISDYSILGNNPIRNVDVLGDVFENWNVHSNKPIYTLPGNGGLASNYKSFRDAENNKAFNTSIAQLQNSNDVFRQVYSRLYYSKANTYHVQQYNQTSITTAAAYNSDNKTVKLFYYGASNDAIFEEFLHAGQDDYYGSKGMKLSSLANEVEAKAANLLSGYKDVSADRNDYSSVVNYFKTGKKDKNYDKQVGQLIDEVYDEYSRAKGEDWAKENKKSSVDKKSAFQYLESMTTKKGTQKQ